MTFEFTFCQKRFEKQSKQWKRKGQSVPPPERRDNGDEQEEDQARRSVTPFGKISRSAITKNMTMVEGHDNQILCNLCPTERLPNGRPQNVFAYHGTTTTHITHLRRQHGNIIDVRDFSPESSVSNSSIRDYIAEGRFGKKMMPCPIERVKANTAALVEVIYLGLRAAAFVEGCAIRWLLHVLEPHYIIPDRTTLIRTHLEYRHTGKNIADAINKTLQEFCLASAKPTYLTDEGANMKCSDILTFFWYKAAEVTKKQNELKALLVITPENVEESDHSVQDHCYAEADSSYPQKITTLKTDCKTRWNSKCIQIQSILENFRFINELLDYHKSDLKITYSERKLLQQLLEFLKTFQENSELMQRDHTPELSSVLPMHEAGLQHQGRDGRGLRRYGRTSYWDGTPSL
ncbi:Uncharacterized protein APZ42_011157 [Daphnia magna]|uniref:Uncharacterized protein n=1 Tax=Daphnia magna TaxID=35525 RepID=A0A162T1V6_9CRUS|nr:Uncharacterized protein APZ42_011157 [Daphnia magna]